MKSQQWVLRSGKNAYVKFDYKTGKASRVISLRSASIFNEDPLIHLGKDVIDAAEKAGIEDLNWKRVDVSLSYPNR